MIPASRSRENRHRNRAAHTRTFAAVLSVLTLAFSNLTTAAADRSPNVLLILTDDQGYGDIGSHGNPDLKTPVLDRLATQGARFERFFVSPVCAPTRASLLTGRYEENLYLWRMMKVAGHTQTEIKELQGYNHGQMADPAYPLLLRFVQRIQQ